MTRPLRIVHCFRSPVGGIFRHIRDLVREHAARGHKVGIVCDSSTGGELEEDMFRSIEDSLALGVRKVPMQRQIGPGDIAAAWRTHSHLRGLAPDILHGHGSKGGAYARAFGTLMRMTGRPVARLYSPHGGVLHYDGSRLGGRVLFGLERLMARFTDHLVFVSQYEADQFAAKIGAEATPRSLVYNGLRESEFDLVKERPDAADLIYVGMMRDLKGPDLFIDALAETRKRTGRDLSAAMVGGGDDLPRYKEQAKRLGLAERIAFHDPMPIREALELGRIVVIPSRAEAMPYVVLEALAAGKSMVATAVGGIPEIFGTRVDVLVEARVEALAARMTEALEDEAGFAARMPPREELRARFTSAVMAARIEEIYQAIAPRR